MSDHDFGAVVNEFRKALKRAAAKGGAAVRGMGLYGVAMAAGRPGLGGFSPVSGVAGRPRGQKSRVATFLGETDFMAAGQDGVQAGGGALAARPAGGAETSYRAFVAQARSQAAAGRARREAEGVALYLPARDAALAGLSFAPPAPDVGAAEGASDPAAPGFAGALARRRRGSVHAAAPAVFADGGASGVGTTGTRRADSGAAGSWGLDIGVAGNGLPDIGEAAGRRADIGLAGGQRFAAATALTPPVIAPADIERALEDYFFRQSRLPPVGGAGFNPLISPVWAGLKIPG